MLHAASGPLGRHGVADSTEEMQIGPPAPLAAAALYRAADLSALAFDTTADLPPIGGLEGQDRAREALAFGAEIAVRGFNIFAIGASAARLQQAMRPMLEAAARVRPCPSDWAYVNNFNTPHRPTAIRLPAARAPAFHDAMHHLIDDLKIAVPTVFEGEDYQTRHGAIEQEFRTRNEEAFSALGDRAGGRGLAIMRTPMGFAVAPAVDGKVVPPEEFNAWTEEKRRAMQSAMRETEQELEQTLRAIPRLEKERRDATRTLNQETARVAIGPLIAETKATFTDVPKVLEYLEAVRENLVDSVPIFIGAPPAGEEAAAMAVARANLFDRYEVNVLVTQSGVENCAPVIEELHPTLGNLLGRVEYVQEQGVLTTNFRLIKPGALHRANDGIILIDARALLLEPFSWAALKRALVRQEIVIEDIARFAGMTTTVSLEPDPIPLDVKIVLFGDRQLYYLLAAADPEFAQHFKVLADFDDTIARNADNEAVIARLIASLACERGLPPLDRTGVARMVEHAARLAGDAAKVTLLVEDLFDVAAEAAHHARKAGHRVIARADVDRAIAGQKHRASRIQENSREMVLRDISLIETNGARVGQINGLSVMSLGNYAFGGPTRITCRVRPGAGRIVDIEREVELGGPLHSKGVLILSGFLAGRYALDAPMSVSASLVFEQSYGGVDGDSASSAELYTLLSALSGQALRQDLAVTGSVNQHGVVQAIGGVNEKIEGFFDICAARGLTGTQGVLIPAANAQHLMLRDDVVAACAAGRFAIYPVRSIDAGISLLTGVDAGARGADGIYPAGSINRLVEDRLKQFVAARRTGDDDNKGDGGKIT